MKTRNKKYSDYGLNEEKVQKTYDFLNSCSDQQKEDVTDIIEQNLPEYVAEFIILALLEHKGYNTLRKMGLSYMANDFYGYKRKGVYLVSRYLDGMEDA